MERLAFVLDTVPMEFEAFKGDFNDLNARLFSNYADIFGERPFMMRNWSQDQLHEIIEKEMK